MCVEVVHNNNKQTIYYKGILLLVDKSSPEILPIEEVNYGIVSNSKLQRMDCFWCVFFVPFYIPISQYITHTQSSVCLFEVFFSKIFECEGHFGFVEGWLMDF